MKFLHKTQFFFRQIFLNVLQARKSIDLNIWQLIEKVTGNCTVFARQAQKGEGGGGREREKSAKEEKRERSASFKRRCFCIPPSIFWTNPTIRDQSQVRRLSAWSELNYFVYRKLSSRDAFFKWYHNRAKILKTSLLLLLPQQTRQTYRLRAVSLFVYYSQSTTNNDQFSVNTQDLWSYLIKQNSHKEHNSRR